MQVDTPSPSGLGSVMWWASQVNAPPRYSASTGAPRFLACSRDSRTRMPAPSPITNPSRSVSQGRDAFSGASHRVDNALRAGHTISKMQTHMMAESNLQASVRGSTEAEAGDPKREPKLPAALSLHHLCSLIM